MGEAAGHQMLLYVEMMPIIWSNGAGLDGAERPKSQ
jgi:hypothetical protein